jgi:hypothetical protein
VAGGNFLTSLVAAPPVAATFLPPEILLVLGVPAPSLLSPPFLGNSLIPIFLMPITPVALPLAMSFAPPAPVLAEVTYCVTPPAAILSFKEASIGSSKSSSSFPVILLFGLLSAGLPLFVLSYSAFCFFS